MSAAPTKAITVLAAGLCAGALLGGCGSATKTVSIAETPPASSTPSTTTASVPAKTTSTATTPSTATTTTSTATTGTAGGTAAPTTTRTAPEPAFTESGTQGEEVSGAVKSVAVRGYTVRDPSEYHVAQTLRVLVGTRTGSTDGYGQKAFFFIDGRFIGTDTKEPSAAVKVVAQSDTEVALAYPLYRSGNSLCCPSGGQAVVHFQLNNGHLTPLGKIPPASSATGYSRN